MQYVAILLLTSVLSIPAVGSDGVSTATEALYELFDEASEQGRRDSPTRASMLGDKRYNQLWANRSLAAISAKNQRYIGYLQRLGEIDLTKLSADDQLNYQLFRRKYARRVAAFAYGNYLMPMSQRGGIQTADELTERLWFSRVEDYRDWNKRLANVDDYVDQHIELLREGIKRGLVPPRIIMERIPKQIKAQLVADPANSPFYKPFNQLPERYDAKVREELINTARHHITNQVIPAYQRLNDFFRDVYLPACRETVGVWDLPDGEAFYADRIREFTTTDMTAEEIHTLGLSEVKRIRAEMQAIIDQLDFDGSFQDFLVFLRTDPQFYFDNPDDLLVAYRETSKRIDPEIVKLFGKLPRMPYGIKPVPDATAPDTTTAYYNGPAADGSRAGYYYVNLYQPQTRPKYEIEVLTVHEAVPGHHLQIALALELEDLPNFRRYSGFTAFIEGWGLYAESLGDELGLYQDPYSKFGQLTYEMWRAVRLVVDTGIHAQGWSRGQAIEFFRENAAKTEHDIINEIDRYISWPGQALAYKIGELTIKRLRSNAEQTLGDQFDIRHFHDVVLEGGALPLDILETRVNGWIEAQALLPSD